MDDGLTRAGRVGNESDIVRASWQLDQSTVRPFYTPAHRRWLPTSGVDREPAAAADRWPMTSTPPCWSRGRRRLPATPGTSDRRRQRWAAIWRRCTTSRRRRPTTSHVTTTSSTAVRDTIRWRWSTVTGRLRRSRRSARGLTRRRRPAWASAAR